MEFSLTYYLLQGTIFFLGIQLLNFLSIMLLLNGYYAFFIYYICFYLLDKIIMYFKLKDAMHEWILDLFDLYPLYLMITNRSQDLWQNSVFFIVKLYLRFNFQVYIFAFYLMNGPRFNDQQGWVQLLLIIAYFVVLVQSANVMYLSNTFKVDIGNIFEFLPYFSVLLQTISLVGLMTLFINTYELSEMWIFILIKLVLILAITPVMCNGKYELYNVSENAGKFFLMTFLMLLTQVLDSSPFFNYGKSKKQDNFKDSKMCSQRCLVAIRVAQFCECLIYFSLIEEKSTYITNNVHLRFFYMVVFAASILNAALTIFYFASCFKNYITKDYIYYSQISVEREVAEKIIYNSPDFIFLEFMQVTDGASSRDQFWYFLLQKSLIPVPSIGFRKITYGSYFKLTNTSVELTNRQFFNIYCEFYRYEITLPEREIRFIEPISEEGQFKLLQSLQGRLFEYGIQKSTYQAFPIKTDLVSEQILQFEKALLITVTFDKMISPFLDFSPAQILFDLFEID